MAAGKGAGGAPAALAGVNWPGFESGATFVAGLGVQKQPTWAGSDFAAAAASLRLLGFNAVRLPFTFDGLQAAPQDVARPCEGPAPNATALAARGADPDAPGRGRGAAAPELYFPPGYGAAGGGGGGGCNGYVPRGPTTLARLLWVAEYLVRAGFYVVLEYRPPAPPGGGGGGQADGGGAPAAAAGVPPELSSPDAFAAAWQRLGAALACVPAWKEAMAGRVALDLLSSPQALHLGWKSAGSGGGGGGDSGMAPLGDYYLSALDALDAAGGAPGLLYLLQGGGDGAPGAAAALGGAFVAGKGDAERLGVASAAGFFGALAGRPYRGRVALAPVIAAGDAGGAELALGPRQWQGYAASWWAAVLDKGRGCTARGPAATQGSAGWRLARSPRATACWVRRAWPPTLFPTITSKPRHLARSPPPPPTPHPSPARPAGARFRRAASARPPSRAPSPSATATRPPPCRLVGASTTRARRPTWPTPRPSSPPRRPPTSSRLRPPAAGSGERGRRPLGAPRHGGRRRGGPAHCLCCQDRCVLECPCRHICPTSSANRHMLRTPLTPGPTAQGHLHGRRGGPRHHRRRRRHAAVATHPLAAGAPGPRALVRARGGGGAAAGRQGRQDGRQALTGCVRTYWQHRLAGLRAARPTAARLLP